jgi:hypothetical protein
MKENKYFNINKIIFNLNNVVLEIENIYNLALKLKIFDEIYTFKVSEKKLIDIGKIFVKKEINIEIIDFNLIFSETIYEKKISGFHESSMIETKKKSILISNIKKGDIILDHKGEDLIVKNVYVFDIEKLNQNQIILLKKSTCGINLPYHDLILSIKNILIIKEIMLKGRTLILNRKASYYNNTNNLKNNFKLYSIETNKNKNYLLSGFIVESI